MTYVSNSIKTLRGQRQGVCHRCGWTGMVGAVRGRDRRVLKTGHLFGRLCQECVTDICGAQPAFRSTHAIAAVRAGRIRKVA
jgi:hypothetical protein